MNIAKLLIGEVGAKCPTQALICSPFLHFPIYVHATSSHLYLPHAKCSSWSSPEPGSTHHLSKLPWIEMGPS